MINIIVHSTDASAASASAGASSSHEIPDNPVDDDGAFTMPPALFRQW